MAEAHGTHTDRGMGRQSLPSAQYLGQPQARQQLGQRAGPHGLLRPAGRAQALRWRFWQLWLCCTLACCLGFASATAYAALPVRAAILINIDSGRILYSQNTQASIPPASLTKIMTMFLTLDAIKAGKVSLANKIRVDRHTAQTGGSSLHLRAGERVNINTLLMGAAVASGNDAATALAKRVSKTEREFVQQMNRKAKGLGMRKTLFKNPTGLPAAGQNTTAADMATLARAYIRAHPKAMRYHNTRFFSHRGRVVRNTNTLLGAVPGLNGLKTGWTIASGYNIIVTAKRGKVQLLAVILGGSTKNTRDNAARRLLEAGFRHPNDPRNAQRAADGRNANRKKKR